ncbi:MAG TPA: hypothetical protein VN030_09140 [Cellvibrio sp.]|nr:hypothetical protein [Cellvibrio sp.]
MKAQWLLFLTVCGCGCFAGEAYSPTDPNTVIAHWPSLQQAQVAKNLRPGDPSTLLVRANHYLTLAAMPGQSRLYGQVQALLKPMIESGSDNPQLWLIWAQLLQHQHAFAQALQALEKVAERDPNNSAMNLLAARIYLIQDKPAMARQSCLRLLGHSDLLTTSTCVLEVTSYPQETLIGNNELKQSYEHLRLLVSREGFPADERGPWVAQVLADMAMRLGMPEAAEQWLASQLHKASVNYLAQWADSQFAQGKPQAVIQYLTEVVNAAGEVDDLLLLQLALAEKKSGETAELFWQTQLAERVALREQRQDQQHADELARYYLEINRQPQKALYWAQLHWQSSRESKDRALLDEARAAVAGQVSLLQGESQQ